METQLSNNEAARLEALYQYQILDTEPEEAFNDIAGLAAYIFSTPIALINLIDEDRQWLKSKIGLEVTQLPHDVGLCFLCIQHDTVVISDTLADERSKANSIVTSDPYIRFYAGAPLITPDGHVIGTLCVLDYVPRSFSTEQVEALQALSRQVVSQLELRRNLAQLVSSITERKRLEAELHEKSLVLENAVEGISRLDTQGRFITVNRAYADNVGYKPEEMIGIEWQATVHPEERENMMAAYQYMLTTGKVEVETRGVRKDGSVFYQQLVMISAYDKQQNFSGHYCFMKDVSERKQTEAQLWHQACHDTLTGLPNRILFIERLDRAIKRTKRQKDYLFAVLFLDLDRFKVVNDSLGHLVGDQLLTAIAHRLESCLRPTDTVARFGGDEFTILLENIKDINDAAQISERIQKELSLPFNLSGHEVFTTASIGIALSTTNYNRPEDILRDADTTMYRAKAGGKARSEVFDPTMRSQAMARLQLETDLQWALQRQEFRLHYQPIVSLKNNKITGFEALLRWYHPLRGIVSAAEFIPIAEETGLIISIGWWVLREACRQMRTWQMQFDLNSSLTISVNLSGKQFSQPDLIQQIEEILQETTLDPCSLKLEITESVLIENAQSVSAMLEKLQALGIRLSIDDFGTGYSSLSYLYQFPIDTLKIDGSFINNVDVDVEKIEIVRTIVGLAWNLGMDVVAEGVETNKQMYQIKALKCEFGQGYLFSKPLETEAMEVLIATKM